jgi:hypothetical protein
VNPGSMVYKQPASAAAWLLRGRRKKQKLRPAMSSPQSSEKVICEHVCLFYCANIRLCMSVCLSLWLSVHRKERRRKAADGQAKTEACPSAKERGRLKLIVYAVLSLYVRVCRRIRNASFLLCSSKLGTKLARPPAFCSLLPPLLPYCCLSVCLVCQTHTHNLRA